MFYSTTRCLLSAGVFSEPVLNNPAVLRQRIITLPCRLCPVSGPLFSSSTTLQISTRIEQSIYMCHVVEFS